MTKRKKNDCERRGEEEIIRVSVNVRNHHKRLKKEKYQNKNKKGKEEGKME